MSEQNILVEKTGRYAVVTINRPRKLNALNKETIDQLDEVMHELKADDQVRCIVISGAGEKAFVAGADIQEIAGLDSEHGQAFAARGQAVFRAIEKMPKPVIAAVQGFALGGGCELAISCHIRIASDDARFGLPEINLGLIPGFGGTQRLGRLIGLSNVLHLLCTGDMVSAERALQMGLVSEVIPRERLMERAHALASVLAAKAPIAMRCILLATYRGADTTLDSGLAIEADLFGHVCDTDDMKIGTSAFLNKKQPEFSGK